MSNSNVSLAERAALYLEKLRRCARCREVLPLDSFTKDSGDKYGLDSLCRPCLATYRRARRQEDPDAAIKYRCRIYGLTPERYAEMAEQQDHLCAICRRLPGAPGFHIDHDHKCCPGRRSCGRCVRLLLCSGCNQGLGNFRDDPSALRAAATYLERSTPSAT